MRTTTRLAAATTAALVALGIAAVPAVACGGLVGENGTIQLERTTTLAAYHDGVERYVTSFEFTGGGESVGSIIPLPDVPSKVERGGDWTLQRLRREVQPPQREAALNATAAAADGQAQVLLEVTVDALDITILKGGGTEVGTWAINNGFLLTPDAPEVLDAYSQRSPIFMAAKFDAKKARELGQGRGDGTPIMLTIPTDQPWVPLRILGLGLDATTAVRADVFLLTDERPHLLTGSGMRLTRSEPASQGLLTDLRTDKGMEWVPGSEWLSYLQLDTTAGELTYDLSASVRADQQPSFVDAALPAPQTFTQTGDGTPWAQLAAIMLVVAGVGTLAIVQLRKQR
jgi:hypothetical protein